MGADGWEVAGAIAASVATVAAVVGLKFARDSANAGREATGLAKDTVELTRQYHEEVERDRRRARLERVGELIEEIHAATVKRGPGFTGQEWIWPRNKLAAALIGLDLPVTFEVTTAPTLDTVQPLAVQARSEVANTLHGLTEG